jgi:O-antigen/teichoic acid export membrane protein
VAADEGRGVIVGIRHWLKHFFIYGSGVVLMNALPFLLIPLYTHAVAPADYGVVELLNRSQELLLLFISLGLRATLLTFYQIERDNPERRSALYSTALQFLAAFSLVILGGAALCAPPLSELLFGGRAYQTAVLMILASTYFESLFQIAALYLQSEVKSTLYVAVFSGRAAFAVAVNYLFIAGLKQGLYGIFWATLIQTSVSSILLLVYVFRHTGFRFHRGLMKDMLRFGLPLVPGAFAGFILNNGDRYFLNIYGTRAEVGVYGLSYRLSLLPMNLVLQPFGKIWSVTMVDLARDKDGFAKLGRICTWLLAACCFATLGISALGPCLVRLVSPQQYWGAYRLIPIIGAAYVLFSWTTVTDASFYVSKLTKYKLASLLAGAAVILPLYWILIRKYTVFGAAWATLGGYIALILVSLYFSQRLYRIQYEWPRITFLFALACALYWLTCAVPPTVTPATVAIRVVAVLMYPAILSSRFFMTLDERQVLGELFTSFLRKNGDSAEAVATPS